MGADVVTPLRASRGGDGGASGFREDDASGPFCIDEKGTAGQDGVDALRIQSVKALK